MVSTLKKWFLNITVVTGFVLLLNNINIAQVIVRNDSINCESVRDGKWFYKEIPNAGFSVRKGNKQISYFPNGVTNEFDINWVGKCEFVMTFVKSSNKDQKIYNKGDELRVTIDEIEGDCYKFTVYAKGRKYPSSQMCKVKE